VLGNHVAKNADYKQLSQRDDCCNCCQPNSLSAIFTFWEKQRKGLDNLSNDKDQCVPSLDG